MKIVKEEQGRRRVGSRLGRMRYLYCILTDADEYRGMMFERDDGTWRLWSSKCLTPPFRDFATLKKAIDWAKANESLICGPVDEAVRPREILRYRWNRWGLACPSSYCAMQAACTRRPAAWRLHARISRRRPGLYAALVVRRRRPFGLYSRRLQGALV